MHDNDTVGGLPDDWLDDEAAHAADPCCRIPETPGDAPPDPGLFDVESW